MKQRLRQLLLSREVESRVVAPVPYYPEWLPSFRRYSSYQDCPTYQKSDGFEVFHPRYPVIPKFGMTVAPYLMAWSAMSAVKRLYESGFAFDLIDAHYFYPDGVAAAMIARQLNVPFVVTARGTDINLIPQYWLARRKIVRAADDAGAIITVCDALRERLIEMGVEKSKTSTLRNGVDPEMFFPVSREQARDELGITGKTLLSVGHLIERKGHHLTIQAMADLPGFKLIVVGIGEEEESLKSLADSLGILDRVRFDGGISQSKLKQYYSACDAFILASSREGMANVLLESMACGCPVIATNIWGTPEVVRGEEAGVLIHERSPEAIVNGVEKLFARLPDRSKTVQYSTNFHWQSTTDGQLKIFKSLVETES